MVSNLSYAGISVGSGVRWSYISQREVEMYAISMVLEIRSFLVLSILQSISKKDFDMNFSNRRVL